MVDPINHDTTSTVATVGGETVKGGLIGAAVPIVGGALLGAMVLALLGAGGLIMGAGAIAGGLIGAGAVAPLAALGGALGLVNGSYKVSAEQQAFQDRIRGPQSQTQQAEVDGVQQGYQIGRVDGQKLGFQQGAQYGAQAVGKAIQDRVMAAQQEQMAIEQQQMAAAQAQPQAAHADIPSDVPADAPALTTAAAEAKTDGLSGPMQMASCECKVGAVNKIESNPVQALANQRDTSAAAAAAGVQVG